MTDIPEELQHIACQKVCEKIIHDGGAILTTTQRRVGNGGAGEGQTLKESYLIFSFKNETLELTPVFFLEAGDRVAMEKEIDIDYYRKNAYVYLLGNPGIFVGVENLLISSATFMLFETGTEALLRFCCNEFKQELHLETIC